MADPRSIRAGRAHVEISAETSRLVAGLKTAQRQMAAFGGTVQGAGMRVAALGVGMAAPLAAATRAYITDGDAIAKMSRRTGIAAEAISELSYAAAQSGVDAATLESGIRRMQRVMSDASQGVGAANNALARLGISARDVDGLLPIDALRLMADRIAAISDPTDRAAAAMEIFGRGGTALLPMLGDGAAGMDALMEEARRLGITMSGRDAQAAEALGDALSRLSAVARRAAVEIGAALAPATRQAADRLTEAGSATIRWLTANHGIVRSVAMLSAATIAAGAAMVGLGAALKVAAVGVGMLAVGVKALLAAKAVIVSIASPIGIVVALMAGLGASVLRATGQGGRALDWLGRRFGGLRDSAARSMGGIADALAAGEVATAAQILGLSVEVAWRKGAERVASIMDTLRDAWQTTWAALLPVAETTWATLETGWAETVEHMRWAGIRLGRALERIWINVREGADHARNEARLLTGGAGLREFLGRRAQIRDAAQTARFQADARAEGREDALRAAADEDRARRERQHADTMALMTADAMLSSAGRQLAAAARRAEAEADLAAAQARLEGAIEAARRRRAEHEIAGDEAPAAGDVGACVRDAMAAARGMMPAMAAATGAVGVRGTFSPHGLLGLAGGVAADRTAAATEECAQLTRRILDEIMDIEQPTF